MSVPLTQAVIEIERHVAASGWDQPPRLYALVDTTDLLRAEPSLAATLGQPAGSSAENESKPAAESWTPIEQQDLPADTPLEDALARIVWPPTVHGCALVVERLMLPPSAEADLPTSGDVAAVVASHPDRQEVRISVGVLRDGRRASAVRLRTHDQDDSVVSGANLVPVLGDALAATLVG
jgi:hypothetical protein